ncbi:MAG: hypothetical protein Q8N21_02390 [bacterium]|nr:hypothetical protein [bacterium]
MLQFTVPQFIDVEDKIIGPITVRQFLILLAGSLLIAVCYKIFDFSAFVTAGVLIFGFSGILAFLKINGRPFHFFVLNLIQTFRRTRLRIWNNAIAETYDYIEEEFSEQAGTKTAETSIIPIKHYTASRLAELALTVDTKGVYKGEGKDN